MTSITREDETGIVTVHTTGNEISVTPVSRTDPFGSRDYALLELRRKSGRRRPLEVHLNRHEILGLIATLEQTIGRENDLDKLVDRPKLAVGNVVEVTDTQGIKRPGVVLKIGGRDYRHVEGPSVTVLETFKGVTEARFRPVSRVRKIADHVTVPSGIDWSKVTESIVQQPGRGLPDWWTNQHPPTPSDTEAPAGPRDCGPATPGTNSEPDIRSRGI